MAGMGDQILASVAGLMQGAASGAMSRVEFEQKLKEEAGKAKLLEAQIRAGQVSPDVGGAIGKRAAQSGIANPDGSPVNPSTVPEATLLQGATGQEETLAFKKLQESERTKREELRTQAHKDAATAKSYTDLNGKIDAEINRRVDNERAIIQARMGGIITAAGEAELRTKETEIRNDVKYEYGAAWAMQHTKVGLMEGTGPASNPKPGANPPASPDVENYLKDISTMTADTLSHVSVPLKFRNDPQVKEAFAKRLKEVGLLK